MHRSKVTTFLGVKSNRSVLLRQGNLVTLAASVCRHSRRR